MREGDELKLEGREFYRRGAQRQKERLVNKPEETG